MHRESARTRHGRLLFLCHRLPYPPDKGERIRAWHMLDHLAGSWDVDLGCLADGQVDQTHLAMLRARCAVVECHTLGPLERRLRAMAGLRPGRPLTLGWFEHSGLRAWVRQGLDRGRYDVAIAYSSAMAPYLMGAAAAPAPRLVLDMVDIDSEKWAAYAAAAQGVRALIWRREARTLLGFERRAVAAFDRSLLVSAAERARFLELAPECADRLDWMDNGVDFRRFDPAVAWPRPYGPAPALVFTGTMNYRPNVDAVILFARAVMPLLQSRHPTPEFHIVGADPAVEVQALAALPGVHVTGSVPAVQPYLAHAAAVVAPLRIARGIQNKVLEAMAMARPVIASPQAFAGVLAQAGRDLLVANGAAETARRVAEVLDGQHPALGAAARAAVLAGHEWSTTLRRLDRALATEAVAHAVTEPANAG